MIMTKHILEPKTLLNIDLQAFNEHFFELENRTVQIDCIVVKHQLQSITSTSPSILFVQDETSCITMFFRQMELHKYKTLILSKEPISIVLKVIKEKISGKLEYRLLNISRLE